MHPVMTQSEVTSPRSPARRHADLDAENQNMAVVHDTPGWCRPCLTVLGRHIACLVRREQMLLAKAEARLAGVRAKAGWWARLVSGLAESFVGRIVRNLSVSVRAIFPAFPAC